MKYCGVVTDRSYGYSKTSSYTVDSYKGMQSAIDSRNRRIYSDEVPMTDENVIQTIKDKSCRMVDFGMNFREAYRR